MLRPRFHAWRADTTASAVLLNDLRLETEHAIGARVDPHAHPVHMVSAEGFHTGQIGQEGVVEQTRFVDAEIVRVAVRQYHRFAERRRARFQRGEEFLVAGAVAPLCFNSSPGLAWISRSTPGAPVRSACSKVALNHARFAALRRATSSSSAWLRTAAEPGWNGS